jgi:peptide-methionine (R)-S-oxide reductase
LVTELCQQLRRRDGRPRVLDDPGELVPVDRAVEADAEPAAVAEVRRAVPRIYETGKGLREYPRLMPKIEKTEQQWRAELAPEQYRVLREKGTEPPFSGEYDHVFEPGTYRCAGCGAELFESEAKYDSGCGWPAFHSPAGEDAIDEEIDTSHGMVRTEVLCASCGGHLGHVFPDGPHPTGLRYCINSAALRLDEK